MQINTFEDYFLYFQRVWERTENVKMLSAACDSALSFFPSKSREKLNALAAWVALSKNIGREIDLKQKLQKTIADYHSKNIELLKLQIKQLGRNYANVDD